MNKKLNFSVLVLFILFVSFVNGVSFTSGPTFTPDQTSVVISWDSDDDTDYYICLNSSQAPFNSCDEDLIELSYNPGPFNEQITGLIADTTYYYFINISNSTPNLNWDSRGNESISNFTTLDNTPPETPDDFTAEYIFDGIRSSITPKVINLTWTAVGDNGMMKNASKYYFAWSDEPIENIIDFNAATRISNDLVPAENGTPDYFEISDDLFDDGIYYFAIVVEDDDENNATNIANASVYIDKQSPQPPKLWWDYDYYITNESSVNVYGYTNESWAEVKVFSSPYYYPSFKTNTNNFSEYNTTFKGEDTISHIIDSTSIGIPLDAGNCPIYANDQNYLEFEEQNQTYLFYYEITDVDEGPYYCMIEYQPSIINNDYLADSVVKFYNNSRPHGWFNISVNLFYGKNNITTKSRDYFNNDWSESSKIITVIYDNLASPTITKEFIEDQIYQGKVNLTFNITDEGKINLGDLFVNVSNNNKEYHFTYPNNISCDNQTLYQNKYNCTINFSSNIVEGYYNVSINVSDIFNNYNFTSYENYYSYDGIPKIVQINDAGLVQSYSDNETKFYFNWSLIPPNPNIMYYNYSIGTKSFPTDNWNATYPNKILNLTNVTNLGNGQYSAWIDFQNCDGFICKPTNGEKYFLTMKAVTSIGESDYISTDGAIFVDDKKPTDPNINILDSFNESYLTSLDRIKINYSSYDYSGIDLYEIIISKEKYTTEDGSTFVSENNVLSRDTVTASVSNEFVNNALLLEQGKDYHIHVRAKDNAGHWSGFGIKSFKVDTTPIENDSITLSGSITPNYNIHVNRGEDDESEILDQKLYVKRTRYENGFCAPGFDDLYFQKTITTSNDLIITLEHGYCYNFHLESINNAGLAKTTYATGSVYNKSIPMDLTSPSAPTNVVIQNGNGIVTYEPDEINFSFQKASDPESGIKNYEYKLEIKGSSGYTNLVEPTLFTTTSEQNIVKGINLNSLNLNLSHGREYRVGVRAYNKFNSSPSTWSYSDDIMYRDIYPPTIKDINLKVNSTQENISYYLIENPENPLQKIRVYNITNQTIQLNITTNEFQTECRYSDTKLLFEDMNPITTYEQNMKNFIFWLNDSKYGLNSIYILCADQQENAMDIWDAIHIKTNLDNVSPEIKILFPLENKTYGRKLQYGINVTDELSLVDKIWFEIVNSSNNSQVFLEGNLTNKTGIFEINNSVAEVIENVTLIFYANDTRKNIGNASVNFTLDTTIPSIIFNPNEEIYYYNNDFDVNIIIDNATYYNISLIYLEEHENLVYNFTNINNTHNQDWNILENVNTSDFLEGKYKIEVFTIRNITNTSTNNNSDSRFIIFDKTAEKYSSTNQIDSSGLPVNTVFNNNANDGYFVNISTNWYDSVIDVNTSPINEYTFEIVYQLKGINFSIQNSTGTNNNYHILDKDALLPGRTIYWKSYSEDMAGNVNDSEYNVISVYNRNITKVGNLLEDTQELLYSKNSTIINLSNYYDDPDYYDTEFYFSTVEGDEIINYSLNQLTKELTITNFENKTGVQRIKIIISDGISNISQEFEYTFANITKINVTNMNNKNSSTYVVSNAYGLNDINVTDINANTSKIINIAKGITNVSFIYNNSGVTSLNNEFTTDNINFSINHTTYNINDINQSKLALANIGITSQYRYNPIKIENFEIYNNETSFLSYLIVTPQNENYKIFMFNKTALGDINNSIDYSKYSLRDTILIEYDENLSYETSEPFVYYNNSLFVVTKDRAKTEICGNSIDDDYDGQTDEGCYVAPPSGGTSGGSSGGGFSSISTPITPVENTTSTDAQDDGPQTSDDDNKEIIYTEDNTKDKTSEDKKDKLKETDTIKDPYEDKPENEFITVDLKPILTGLLFILIVTTLIIGIMKNPLGIGKQSMTLSEKVDYLSEKSKQKYKEVINNDIINYINFALDNNYGYETARENLLKHGFDKVQIDKHISILKQKEIDISRIKNYLDSKWENKPYFEKAIKDLESVGWSKDYIQTAVNKIIKEK